MYGTAVSFSFRLSCNRAMSTATMPLESLQSPLHFLQFMGCDVLPDWLQEYASWWEKEGQAISDAVDRAGTLMRLVAGPLIFWEISNRS